MPFTLPKEVIDKNEFLNYDKELSATEQKAHDSDVRKRIDNLLDNKRLRDMLDDSDDW